MSSSTTMPTVKVGDYELEKDVIGSGSQGEVVRGRHIYTNKYYAIKVVSTHNASKSSVFENEILLASLCRNAQRTVKVHKSFVKDKFGFIVMDLLETDLLENLLVSTTTSEKQVAAKIYQILLALQELHALGIAHLDVKPENVLIDSDGALKLCDLGNSVRVMSPNQLISGLHGTFAYACPEMKAKKKYHPMKGDSWSVGILMHVLLTGCFPFGAEDKLLASELDLTYFHSLGLTDCCEDILKSLLEVDPQKRILVEDALHHPWFNCLTTSPPRMARFIGRIKNIAQKL